MLRCIRCMSGHGGPVSTEETEIRDGAESHAVSEESFRKEGKSKGK